MRQHPRGRLLASVPKASVLKAGHTALTPPPARRRPQTAAQSAASPAPAPAPPAWSAPALRAGWPTCGGRQAVSSSEGEMAGGHHPMRAVWHWPAGKQQQRRPGGLPTPAGIFFFWPMAHTYAWYTYSMVYHAAPRPPHTPSPPPHPALQPCTPGPPACHKGTALLRKVAVHHNALGPPELGGNDEIDRPVVGKGVGWDVERGPDVAASVFIVVPHIQHKNTVPVRPTSRKKEGAVGTAGHRV